MATHLYTDRWMRWLVSLVLLCACPPAAVACGLSLSWNDCALGATAAASKAFACNTNDGYHVLTVSFDHYTDIPDVTGLYVFVDLVSESCPMPSWWEFRNSGSCRLAGLSATALMLPWQTACADPWQGQGSAAISGYYNPVQSSHRHSRIVASVVVPAGFSVPIVAGTEYYGVNLLIRNQQTVGAGACAGCTIAVCLVIAEVALTSIDSGETRITSPGTSALASWQPSGNFPCVCSHCDPPAICTTPVVNRTWGQIKSLYR